MVPKLFREHKIVVVGGGGVGKTAVVLQVCYAFAHTVAREI
jgi:GTPase SAR1 family protein